MALKLIDKGGDEGWKGQICIVCALRGVQVRAHCYEVWEQSKYSLSHEPNPHHLYFCAECFEKREEQRWLDRFFDVCPHEGKTEFAVCDDDTDAPESNKLIPEDKIQHLRFGQLIFNALCKMYGLQGRKDGEGAPADPFWGEVEDKLWTIENDDLQAAIDEFLRQIESAKRRSVARGTEFCGWPDGPTIEVGEMAPANEPVVYRHPEMGYGGISHCVKWVDCPLCRRVVFINCTRCYPRVWTDSSCGTDTLRGEGTCEECGTVIMLNNSEAGRIDEACKGDVP